MASLSALSPIPADSWSLFEVFLLNVELVLPLIQGRRPLLGRMENLIDQIRHGPLIGFHD